VTSLLGWLAITALGVLVLLEAMGVIDDSWRIETAEFVSWLADPDLSRWSAVLVGLAAGIIAIVLLIAQLVPAKETVPSVVIDKTEAGSTLVNSATVYRQISRELEMVDGVHSVKPEAHRKRLRFRLELADHANAGGVLAEARDAISSGVWDSLGIPPRPIDLTMTFRRTPTPVTRKETIE
jgi:hypothetical protein